jgi:hypothetical protein
VGSSPFGPGSTATAKLLTGSNIVKMVTSFSRRPLLLGAQASASLAYSSMAYPPMGNAEAAGIEELKFAYAAAFTEAVTGTTNNWATYLGNHSNVKMTEACTINPTLYKYPVPTPGGQLANILARGRIQLAYLGATTYRADDGYTLMNTNMNPPTGGVPSFFFSAVIAAMGAHYGVTIQQEWSYMTADQAFSVGGVGWGVVWGPVRCGVHDAGHLERCFPRPLLVHAGDGFVPQKGRCCCCVLVCCGGLPCCDASLMFSPLVWVFVKLRACVRACVRAGPGHWRGGHVARVLDPWRPVQPHLCPHGHL